MEKHGSERVTDKLIKKVEKESMKSMDFDDDPLESLLSFLVFQVTTVLLIVICCIVGSGIIWTLGSIKSLVNDAAALEAVNAPVTCVRNGSLYPHASEVSSNHRIQPLQIEDNPLSLI